MSNAPEIPSNNHSSRGNQALINFRFVVIAALLLTVYCSCKSPALPPIDFSQSGWRIQQGQAVWKPNQSAPELAGDLLVATNSLGNSVIQFTKTPLPLVVAQVTGGRWQIEIPVQNRRYAGRGKPPSRIGWFQLNAALQGKVVPTPWSLRKQRDGNWRLDNSKTGESIEGFVNP